MTDLFTQRWSGEDLSEDEFLGVRNILLEKFQFDIDAYKDSCIRRRIAKRFRASKVEDFPAYLKLLQHDQNELDALMTSISVHVSHFFRNPETFRIIENTIFPNLARRARSEGRKQLRVWSAGCASGEEPYSLAILIDSLAATDLDIRVIATDISDPVLQSARLGLFDMTHLKEVPPVVRDQYFQTEGPRYRIKTSVQKIVDFQHHNIMSTMAFPTADMIVCRNVLIYFNRLEQWRVMQGFAEALPEDGILVLGRSETLIREMSPYFKLEYPVERIYRRTAEPAKFNTL